MPILPGEDVPPPIEVWPSLLAILAPSGGAAGQRPHFPLFPEGRRLYSSAFINTQLISLVYSVTGYGSFLYMWNM